MIDQAIRNLIDAGVCRSTVHVATTPSTNTLALEALAKGEVTGTALPRLYLADEQTAGRGRRGRSWLSRKGSLTFSLVVDATRERGGLDPTVALAAGVGVAEAIEFEFAPIRLMLKWPNDVYLAGGKLAGILCEASQAAPGMVVVGIGINIASAPDLSAPDLGRSGEATPERRSPTGFSGTITNQARSACDVPTDAVRPISISEVVGRKVTAGACLEPIVTRVLERVDAGRIDPAGLIASFRTRCLLTGRPVECQRNGHPTRGRCLGVTDEGHLLIDTDRGVVACRSGEATRIRGGR